MVRTLFMGFMAISVFLFSCTNSTSTRNNTGDPGSAYLTVTVEKVGTLGKTSAISLNKLYLTLSSPGETTIADTFPLSGIGVQTVAKTYSNLASLIKTWTLHAETRDMNGVVIHSGDTSFIIPAQSTIAITLNLTAKYSMLKANIFPIRDSVTRCALLVDGEIKDDSSFAKQSLLGDTVTLTYDYLQTGIGQRIKLNVYGTMWGFDTLLYTGDTLITPVAGENENYDLVLRWVGPGLPPDGQVDMKVIIGAIGTTTVNGKTEGPPIISVQPLDQTVNKNEQVTFSVVANGYPQLSYQWRKDGLQISGATNANYTIGSVKNGDEGTYAVIVSNSKGNVQSRGAYLTVGH
jgi:hypothetical protein